MRNLTSPTIKTFRGINRFSSLTSVSPDYATDLMNVFVSGSGGLEKMRLPTSLHAALPGIVSGPQQFFDFQTPTTRNILCRAGNVLYKLDAVTFAFVKIDDNNALNNTDWSEVDSNNLAFMTNGLRNLKWSPQTGVENWGIAAPVNKPTFIPAGWVVDTVGNNGAVRAGGLLTIKTTVPHSIPVGALVTTTGITDATMNAANQIVTFVPDNMHISFANAGVNAVSGGGAIKIPGLTVANNVQWRYSYKNSITQHEGNLSPWSALSGVFADQAAIVSASAPIDPQVDTIVWYRSYNNGSDPQLEKEVLIANGGLTLVDNVPDAGLDGSIHGTIISDPPPVGKYLVKWAGRIFILSIENEPTSIAYTGYEKISVGRPEEACPPGNRLRLAVGSDIIAGGGAIQNGIIVFSQSNEMFMFRGVPEDIVTTSPIAFTEILEQLPWQEGLTAHSTVQSTPYGLVYQASDLTIKVYDGADKPSEISSKINPILRRITPSQKRKSISSYLNYVDRDWYIFGCKVDGEIDKFNRLIMFDLTPNPDGSLGIFISNIEFDGMGMVEDADGVPRFMISNDGILQQLIVISETDNGITSNILMTDKTLDAWYRTGAFGADTPNVMKLHRYGKLITDTPGFSIVGRFTDDRTRTITKPEIINYVLDGTKAVYNRKGNRMEVEIRFPKADRTATVLEYTHVMKNTGER